MEPHHEQTSREPEDVHLARGGHPPLGVTARAVVDRVIDGDTLLAHVQWPIRIRLKDCWAPELRGDHDGRGQAAKDHMEKIAPVGSRIVFNVDSHDASSLGDLMTFGRIVANVWREGDQESLSQIMVGTGFATESKP